MIDRASIIAWCQPWFLGPDPKSNTVLNRRVTLLEQEIKKMATVADLQSGFMSLQTSITNAVNLLAALKKQLDAGAPDQATIDGLAKELTDAKTALDAAVVANTPATT